VKIVCKDCAFYQDGNCHHNGIFPKLEYSTCPCATKRPKAYKVFDYRAPEESIVVFATTAGKAKMIALSDAYDGYDFIELRAYRIKPLDVCYKQGKTVMDWYDQQDRLDMFNLGGYRCEEIGYGLCDDCLAKDKCDIYNDYQEYLKELEKEK